jgi:hypothetical protein
MFESQIAEEIETMATLHPLQTPADRIFLGIARNRTRHPNGRRYSVETLAWSREIHDISPRPWEIVRRVLPLPGDHLLLSKFADTQAVIASALLDLDEMEGLIDLWEQSHEDIMTDRRVILSVHAIAFRLMVTISDDGSVDGSKDLTHLDNPDLLTQFLADSAAFSVFLREHWDSTSTALFVFQI